MYNVYNVYNVIYIFIIYIHYTYILYIHLVLTVPASGDPYSGGSKEPLETKRGLKPLQFENNEPILSL